MDDIILYINDDDGWNDDYWKKILKSFPFSYIAAVSFFVVIEYFDGRVDVSDEEK